MARFNYAEGSQTYSTLMSVETMEQSSEKALRSGATQRVLKDMSFHSLETLRRISINPFAKIWSAQGDSSLFKSGQKKIKFKNQ